MNEDQCETAFHQDRQFAAGLFRVADPSPREFRAQQSFDGGLMSPGDGASWMARKISQLHGQSGKPGPGPLRAGSPSVRIAKEPLNEAAAVLRQALAPALDAGKGKAALALKNCREKIVLAAEMLIERAFGQPGRFCDRVDPDPVEPFS